MAWIRGTNILAPAPFIGLITDYGEIMLIPRLLGAPIEMKCTPDTSQGKIRNAISNAVIALRVEFVPPYITNNESLLPKYSISPHPTEPKFVCSNGFAVAEFTTNTPSIVYFLRKTINEIVIKSQDRIVDDTMELWRMALGSEHWTSPDLLFIFDSIINRLLLVESISPLEILTRCLSFNMLGWNAAYQTGFHTVVILIESIFEKLLNSTRYSEAYKALEIAERSINLVFSLVRVGTRYYEDTISELDLSRTRNRLRSNFEFRDQWLRLYKALEDVKEKNKAINDLLTKVNLRSSLLTKKQQLITEISEEVKEIEVFDAELKKISVPLEEARKFYSLQNWAAAREALAQAGSTYSWGLICLHFHLNELRRNFELVHEIINRHPRPPHFFSTLSISTFDSPLSPDIKSDLGVKGVDEKYSLNGCNGNGDLAYWGPVYAVLLLARGMESYYLGHDVTLIAPTSPPLAPPIPLASPGSKAISTPLTSKRHIVSFKRASRSLERGVNKLMSSHESGGVIWSVQRCVNLFRWCRRPKEAIHFVQKLATYSLTRISSSASSPLRNSHFHYDEKENNNSSSSSSSYRGHVGRRSSPNQSYHHLRSTQNSCPLTLRELCELSTALAVVESGLGPEVLSPRYFWLTLQWHLITALETWDLNSLLSFFDAHPSILQISLFDSEKVKSNNGGTGSGGGGGGSGGGLAGGGASSNSRTVNNERDSSTPPALLALFRAVRARFTTFALEYWEKKLLSILRDEINLPLILSRKPTRRSSRHPLIIKPVSAIPVPWTLSPLPCRSPLFPLFYRSNDAESDEMTPVQGRPKHFFASGNPGTSGTGASSGIGSGVSSGGGGGGGGSSGSSGSSSSSSLNLPKNWDDSNHRISRRRASLSASDVKMLNTPLSSTSSGSSSSLTPLLAPQSPEDIEEEAEIHMSRDSDDIALDDFLVFIERSLFLVNTLSLSLEPSVDPAAFRKTHSQQIFRFLWYISVRHILRYYVETLQRLPSKSFEIGNLVQQRSQCAMECARWSLRLLPLHDLVNLKGREIKGVSDYVIGLVFTFLSEVEVGSELVEIVKLIYTIIHTYVDLRRHLTSLLKRVEITDPCYAVLNEILESAMKYGESKYPDGIASEEELPDPDTHIYTETEHDRLDPQFAHFRGEMLFALADSSYRSRSNEKDVLVNTLSPLIQQMLDDEEKWNGSFSKRSRSTKPYQPQTQPPSRVETPAPQHSSNPSSSNFFNTGNERLLRPLPSPSPDLKLHDISSSEGSRTPELRPRRVKKKHDKSSGSGRRRKGKHSYRSNSRLRKNGLRNELKMSSLSSHPEQYELEQQHYHQLRHSSSSNNTHHSSLRMAGAGNILGAAASSPNLTALRTSLPPTPEPLGSGGGGNSSGNNSGNNSGVESLPRSPAITPREHRRRRSKDSLRNVPLGVGMEGERGGEISEGELDVFNPGQGSVKSLEEVEGQGPEGYERERQHHPQSQLIQKDQSSPINGELSNNSISPTPTVNTPTSEQLDGHNRESISPQDKSDSNLSTVIIDKGTEDVDPQLGDPTPDDTSIGKGLEAIKTKALKGTHFFIQAPTTTITSSLTTDTTNSPLLTLATSLGSISSISATKAQGTSNSSTPTSVTSIKTGSLRKTVFVRK